MADFTIAGGVATIDVGLVETWQDRTDYLDALVAIGSPEVQAKKRVMIDFEAETARIVRAGTVDQDIDALIEKYVDEEYIQHDPNIEDGRAGLATFFRHGGFGDTPPVPIALIVEDDLITMMLQMPEPDPDDPDVSYDRVFLSIFRIRGDLLVEHWDPMPKFSRTAVRPS